jgi:glycine/D-amino acid oxidase-like deaminating enzyme
VGASRVLAATYTRYCARVHPARLVRGLARAVERRGATIYELTPALRLEPAAVGATRSPRVVTSRGMVRARYVVRATEAWTTMLPGSRREVAPVYSLMVATEPLPPAFWARAGMSAGETFSDHRHLIIYGQRTADDRLAFGGRGAPYHAGSRIRPDFDRDARIFAQLRATLTASSPACGVSPSPTPGAGRSASLGTGTPASGWMTSRASRRPAVTSGTASGPRTLPVARWPTCCSAGTPS